MEWSSQTVDRVLEEGDRMFLNALNNQVIQDSEMISLNYLPDIVPLDSKFIIESNSSQASSSSQSQTQAPIVVLNCNLTKVVEPSEANQMPNEVNQMPVVHFVLIIQI